MIDWVARERPLLAETGHHAIMSVMVARKTSATSTGPRPPPPRSSRSRKSSLTKSTNARTQDSVNSIPALSLKVGTSDPAILQVARPLIVATNEVSRFTSSVAGSRSSQWRRWLLSQWPRKGTIERADQSPPAERDRPSIFKTGASSPTACSSAKKLMPRLFGVAPSSTK